MDWSIYVLLLVSVSETRILWDTSPGEFAQGWKMTGNRTKKRTDTKHVSLDILYIGVFFKYGILRV